MSTKLLQDKVIFLTGGAQGIGRECALAYASEGAHVIIADQQAEAAQQTISELPTSGLAVHCDVSSRTMVEAAIQKSLAEFGRLDAIHNNAGISSPSKPLHETTEDEWDRLQ